MTGMSDGLLAERRRLLEEGAGFKALAERLEDEDDFDAAQNAWEARRAAVRSYLELLPSVPVARCPFSGDVVNWPIDIIDLDGWFWNHEAPARYTPPLPSKWLTMTGAMKVREPATPAPFRSEPGPGVPYVVPRILDQPQIVAVITEIPVGRHTGWPISYFGPRPAVELENVWGGDKYDVYNDDGSWRGWDTTTPGVRHYDFDLEPWVRSGRLLWIAPGDDSVTLRRGVDGCPYLGIEGPRELAFIKNGKVRYP